MSPADLKGVVDAATLSEPDQSSWCAALVEAARTATDRDSFVAAVAANLPARGLPEGCVDELRRVLDEVDDPTALVEELRRLGPDELQSISRNSSESGSDAPVDEWSWVPAGMQEDLEVRLGPAWRDQVASTFGRVWPGWQAADAETKAATLESWREVVVADAGGGADAPSDEWSWVPAGMREELEGAVGPRWRQLVATTFDGVWPGWQAADGETKAATLESWREVVLAGAGVDTSDESTASVVQMTWITPLQRAALDDLTESRGPWEAWLPGELDTHWPDWRQGAAADLTSWLDTLLPTLLLAPDMAKVADQILAPALEELMTTDVDEIAAETGLDPETVRTILASVSTEELTQAAVAELQQ